MLREIAVEIIRACPQRCMHCSSMASPDCTEMLRLATFADIVCDAQILGVRRICFSGGEPFLHPELDAMVRMVHEAGMDSCVYSCGIVLSGQNSPESLQACTLHSMSECLDRIIFNLPSADEAVFDRITGTHGRFPLLLESIRRAKVAGLTVEVHYVPMQCNMRDIEGILFFCNSNRIDQISFLRLVLHGRADINASEIEATPEEVSAFCRRAVLAFRRSETQVRVGVPILGETSAAQCQAAFGKLNIRYDGKVYPCEVFKNGQGHLGRLGTPDSIHEKRLLDIYRDSPYLNAVRECIRCVKCSDTEPCIGQQMMNTETEGTKARKGLRGVG